MLKYKKALIGTILLILFFAGALTQEVGAFSVNGGSYERLSSYAEIKTFDYATKPVRENFIRSDMVDAEYTFKLGSKAVDAYFGNTGYYTETDGVKRKGFFLNKNTKGKCGVRYNKLFQYNNNWIDVRTTYTNWSMHDKNKAFASGGFCSIWWTEIKWLKMKHEFFLAGTNIPVRVNGFFTYIDIDDEQGLGIPSNQIKKIWVNSKGTILNYKKEDGITMIKSDDIIIPNRSHADYSAQKAATATFSYQFSGTNHTQYVLDGNADHSNNIITFDAAKYIPSQIPLGKPPSIEKHVSDSNETNVLHNTVSNQKEEWTYNINGLVPLETEAGNFYDGFRFTDTLDACLEIKDIQIYQDNNTKVTDRFTITRSGQTITAASRDFRSAAFYGHNYQLRIKVGIKAGREGELRNHGHYNNSKQSWMFRNTGKVLYKERAGETSRTTNEVVTELPRPALKITKEAEKKEYCVGELVDYTIRVSQSRPNASAVNLVITDDTLPPELTILPETVRISGIDDAEIKLLENGFQIKANRLPYGKTIFVRYKARAESGAAHKNWINTARVSADLLETVQAQASIHVASFQITGKKIWDDQENQDGIRPDNIRVNLLANGEKIRAESVSSKSGWSYTFDDLERIDQRRKEISYRIEEEPIPGYNTKIEGYNIVNQHVPEQITISGKKTWNDVNDLDTLRPNKVVVYLTAGGAKVKASTISVKENWSYSWTVDKYHSGRSIDYKVEEKPVDQYKTTADGYNLMNTHIPYMIELKKYEKLEDGQTTKTPLSGAEYLFYRVDAPDEYLGSYKTDQEGKLKIGGVKPGYYYLIEEKAPTGYQISQERVNVTVHPVETDKALDGPAVTEVQTYNQRIHGQLQFIKKDDSGNSVEGAEFGVYIDEACNDQIGVYRTDSRGTFTIKELKWGNYYLKELRPPKGYAGSDQCWKVRINAEKLNYIIQGENKQKRGSVVLTKTDETGRLRLEKAVYELYKDSGELVRENFMTDSAGQIKAESLPWGGYYFKEKKAPPGYGLSSELIRFTVNSTTGGITQQVQAKDYAKRAELKITKQIRATDLHYAHGVPSFIFKVSGTAADGEENTYYQMVSFPKASIENHTDSDGIVKIDAVFSGLKAGSYVVEEMKHLRYALSEIKGISDNGKKDGNLVKFNLSQQLEGTATFVNEKKDWQDYSDTEAKTNMIKIQRRLTALAVNYTGPKQLEGNSLFPKSKLEVTAVYDDGTERSLSADEYSLEQEDGTTFVRVPKAAGDYIAFITYSEGGITCRQSTGYRVEAVKMQVISFQTCGGEPLQPLIVEKYSCLSDYKKERYTPKRQGFSFKGWFENDQLSKSFGTSDLISEDKTLYASWEMRHLDDYSWKEIKQISDSGKAETVFSECFEQVKSDLKDGGLSKETLKHTKSFTVKGMVYHAMLMGFNQDLKKEDGSKAGLSFLTYESLMNSEYNPSLTNAGGWKDSAIREKIAELLPELPLDLKASITAVEKTTYLRKGTSVEKSITLDKLWIPAQSELYGAWGYDDEKLEPSIFFDDADYGRLKSVKGEGEQYKLFRGLIPDGELNREQMLAYGSSWWLRSPAVNTDERFCYVDENGASR